MVLYAHEERYENTWVIRLTARINSFNYSLPFKGRAGVGMG